MSKYEDLLEIDRQHNEQIGRILDHVVQLFDVSQTLVAKVGTLETKVNEFMTEQRQTNEDFRRSIRAISDGVSRLAQSRANTGGDPFPTRARPHG